MSRLLVIEPLPIGEIAASRGSGAANLKTVDPQEAWVDAAAGVVTISVDLGAVRTIDTIFLGYVGQSTAATTWQLSAGLSSADAIILPASPLRVPDVAGEIDPIAHALWFGDAVAARFLAIRIEQPAGAPLTAGVLVVGRAFVARLGQEWGAGRQPIDTGSATSLPSGGFAIVEGVRKLLLNWTFGDLTIAETEQLEGVALRRGETFPGLVVEDAERTAGLRRRIHYGLFKKWRAFERRNRVQTRWEISIEQWV